LITQISFKASSISSSLDILWNHAAPPSRRWFFAISGMPERSAVREQESRCVDADTGVRIFVTNRLWLFANRYPEGFALSFNPSESMRLGEGIEA
jgi:hypothetical protein